MAAGRISILIPILLTAACASRPPIPIVDASTLIGRWENRSGGFFRLSWDQCEFFRDQKFSCTSYPLKDDLVLSYDGLWSLTENQLQLHLEHDATYIYYITEMGNKSFTIESRLSGVRTFYRVNEFN